MRKTLNKTTGKAKRLIMAAALCILSITQAWAYDFSVVVSSGQTLYFNIKSNSTLNEVYITYPNSNAQSTNECYSGYTKPTGNLIIPSSVTYNGITYSITSIGNHAFHNCTGLTSVNIPNSVTTIGYSPFYECSGLTSVTIPNSVTDIGDYAFNRCSSLNTFTIPSSVQRIGRWAFYGTAYYNNSSNWVNNVLYKDNCLLRADSSLSGSYSIQNNTRVIAGNSFGGCTSLNSVTIPNTVVSIANYAFNATGLTSVTIPNSVTNIEYCAFRYCSNLTSVTLPNLITTIDSLTFYGCSSLTSVTIPNSVTSIGKRAFAYCGGLTSVTIPNSVTTIGDAAFYECTGLTSVTIPNSVTTIGDNAFYFVKNIIYSGTATGSPWGALHVNCYVEGDFMYSDSTKNILIAYIGNSSNVTIPNSVTSIGIKAFYNCSGLTSVTIPNSVDTIGDYAFAYCTGLTSVTIPNSVTTIGYAAFYGCSGLTSVNIPNSVTTIGESAFYECTGLTSVTIPNSVTSIGELAFYECTGLTSVTIPNSVTTIGYATFAYCTGLTSVTIPNSVGSIGEAAFYGCTGLTSLNFNAVNCNDFSYSNYHPFYGCPISTINIGDSVQRIPGYFVSGRTSLISVTIPNSVDSIGVYAFYNCTSIGRIDLQSVTPPIISSNSFQNVNSAIPVYIPCGSLSNYSNSNWGTRFPNLQENQVFSLGVAVNDSTMGMALILSNTCANSAIQAYAYDGYNFVGWSDGSTMNPRVVTLTRDTVFTAIFEANVQRYTITVMSANNNMGTVSGGGTYEEGTQATITATPAENHHFVSWNDGNTDNPRTITVTGDATYIANFAEDIQVTTYTITVMSANNNMGTVSGSGTYEEGTQATITATPAENHHFVSWNDGNTDNPRTITVTGDAVYIANFAEDVQITTYTITVMSANNNMGSVMGGGTYEEGAQASFAAIPTDGHHFVSWNDGNTDNPRTITVTGDATYIASFAEDVSIDAANELDALTFHPNPTSGTITFNCTDIRKVEIMDAMGRMVAIFENSNVIDLSKLGKGYYAMRITTDNGVAIRKVVRN